MFGAGIGIQSMINSLKNNKRKKRELLFDKEKKLESGDLDDLIEKKFTKSRQTIIKNRLIKERNINRIKSLILFIIIMSLCYLVYNYISQADFKTIQENWR